MPFGQIDNGNAVVFYRGPSELNGAPIVGVLTGLWRRSHNAKTGDMAQVYILVDGMNPTEAIASGADAAICGDCRLRGDGVRGRGCFVTWWQGPGNVYKALAMRKQQDVWSLADRLRGRWVRLAYYGDPTAIPMTVWAPMLSRAAGWVGYTQQWRKCDPSFKFYLMASCLDEADYQDARAAGWRTYRVRKPDGRLLPGEVICPASEEADHRAQCEDCGLCQGAGARAANRSNAAIIVHGKPGNWAAFGLPFPHQTRGPRVETHELRIIRPRNDSGRLPPTTAQTSPPMAIADAVALARQPLPGIRTIRWWGRG